MIRNWLVPAALILAGLLFVTWIAFVFYDPIDRLAIRLSLRSFNGPSLENGMFGTMNSSIPASANAEDLVQAIFGSNESYQILEAKKVWIIEPTSSSPCIAAFTERVHRDGFHDKTIYLFLYRKGCWHIGMYVPDP
jgi:hypothetical protein